MKKELTISEVSRLGGHARAKQLSAEERKAIATKAGAKGVATRAACKCDGETFQYQGRAGRKFPKYCSFCTKRIGPQGKAKP